ncbi:MAG TPA: hypothetical protein VMZ52_04170, partial [Bryobacteraceae bacterium]|nr:hypothetical protein [Bryobacteraceae bacterium]
MPLLIAVIQPNRTNPGRNTGVHVTPSVPNQETVFQCYLMAGGGLQNQARERLSACASVAVIVITAKEIVEGQFGR